MMASAGVLAIAAKASAYSPERGISTGCTFTPSAGAASLNAASCSVVLGFRGFTRTATRLARGSASFSTSSRFTVMSVARRVRPVTFPPGRAKLATNPAFTGSIPLNAITIGTVWVAFLAALMAGGLTATMMSTLARTRSAARPGRRPGPSAKRRSTTRFLPSTHPSSCRRRLKSSVTPTAGWFGIAIGAVGERRPTRAIVPACCASAPSGPTRMLPPTIAMNARRSITG